MKLIDVTVAVEHGYAMWTAKLLEPGVGVGKLHGACGYLPRHAHHDLDGSGLREWGDAQPGGFRLVLGDAEDNGIGDGWAEIAEPDVDEDLAAWDAASALDEAIDLRVESAFGELEQEITDRAEALLDAELWRRTAAGDGAWVLAAWGDLHLLIRRDAGVVDDYDVDWWPTVDDLTALGLTLDEARARLQDEPHEDGDPRRLTGDRAVVDALAESLDELDALAERIEELELGRRVTVDVREEPGAVTVTCEVDAQPHPYDEAAFEAVGDAIIHAARREPDETGSEGAGFYMIWRLGGGA